MEILQFFVGLVTFIIWMVASFYVWKLYHKMFRVTYFGFAGLAREIFYCLLGGLLVASIIFSPIMLLFGEDKQTYPTAADRSINIRQESFKADAPIQNTPKQKNIATAPLNTPPASLTPPTSQPSNDSVKTDIGKAVYDFYNSINSRQFNAAYNYFSPKWQNGIDYNKWAQGFDTTLSNKADILEITNVTNNSATVKFRLTARDRDQGGVLVQVFEGSWNLVLSNNRWLLNEPNIRRVNSYRE